MSSNPLLTTLLGVTMKNPIIAASGTFGFGREYSEHMEVSLFGGISSKGLTLNGSRGNDGERIYETASGILNSIGLENPGVRNFINNEYPFMRSLGPAVIVNLGGHSESDYLEGVSLLNEIDYDILELNISCPNVKEGGMAFGMKADTALDLVKKVRQITNRPLLVKLSPNALDIVSVAKACEQAGADGLSLVNTFLGMAIDVNKRAPVFNNVYAGLSGPAIMPLALRMTHAVAHAVNIPVVGLGGITSAEDALCFLMAGAAAVQIGTANFVDPNSIKWIVEGLKDYCERNGLKNISQIHKII